MTEEKVREVFKVADELAAKANEKSECYREVFHLVFGALTRQEWLLPTTATDAILETLRRRRNEQGTFCLISGILPIVYPVKRLRA
jgi:HD-like signal output (HDOD) protein